MPTVLSMFDMNPCKFGSMEEYAVHLTRALEERGCQSVLVFRDRVAEPVQAQFQGTAVRFDVLERGGRFQFYSDVVRFCRKYRADVLHFHFFEQFSLLPIVARLAGPKLVVFTDHFRQPLQLRRLTRWQLWLWNRLVPPLVKLRMLAPSQHIKRTLTDFYSMSADTIRVVHNGVALQRFAEVDSGQTAALRTELAIPPEAPVVVCVAALIPEKGVHDLLVAAREVLAQRPEIVVAIVGEGPLDKSLRQAALDLGIGAGVRFTGMRSDVHRFMALATMVVVPSVWQEPAGLVVLEGMAAGRPVVACRVGGIPEQMTEGVTGILVEPHAPQQLAAALLRLLGSPQEALQMGSAGRALVEQRFTMERWIHYTLQVYQEVIPCDHIPPRPSEKDASP